MTVVEELMAQRDAILFGEHVRRQPERAGEACAVAREFVPLAGSTFLSTKAKNALAPVFSKRWERDIVYVNDYMPEVTTAAILDAFDEAIRNAKEQEDATA